jgi:nucleotide-binding universal stress UspA family protein
MTVAVIVLTVALAVALVTLAAQYLRYRTKRPANARLTGTRRILFPYLTYGLSSRALDAALRLALAEGATLVPVVLMRVPLDLPIDAALSSQAAICLPLQEAIEQRAAAFGVPVDARIERGRTYRHALRQAIKQERFDRIVIAAAANGQPGFDADDIAWLLENAPGEIVVLRPNQGEQIGPPPPRRRTGVRARRMLARPAGAQARSAGSEAPSSR